MTIVIPSATCCKCEEYYVEDKKHLIYVDNRYYCMICLKKNTILLTTIFSILCKNNDIKTTQKIIDYGVELNIKNNNQILNPIHSACIYNHNILDILINSGINVNIYDNHFIHLPLINWVCYIINHYQRSTSDNAIHKLVDAGAKINLKDFHGKRPIDYCRKNSSTYNLLIKLGADV